MQKRRSNWCKPYVKQLFDAKLLYLVMNPLRREWILLCPFRSPLANLHTHRNQSYSSCCEWRLACLTWSWWRIPIWLGQTTREGKPVMYEDSSISGRRLFTSASATSALVPRRNRTRVRWGESLWGRCVQLSGKNRVHLHGWPKISKFQAWHVCRSLRCWDLKAKFSSVQRKYPAEEVVLLSCVRFINS